MMVIPVAVMASSAPIRQEETRSTYNLTGNKQATSKQEAESKKEQVKKVNKE